MKPDFSNCILNVTSSIMKKYKVKSNYQSIVEVDNIIKNSKHVFFVILDGLGKNIIEQNLSKDSFIRKNITKWITSVYPPTTVAATTAAQSGISPGQSGWIGWHQYFNEIKNDVVLFKNKSYYKDESFSYNVADKYIPYEPFDKKFNGIMCKSLYPSFMPGGYDSFSDMGKEMIRISHLDDMTYTYCYWDNPDYCIHEYGVNHENVKNTINELDKELENIYQECNNSTSIIMIADHGLVDIENIYLEDYPDLLETLEIEPSLEARTTAFKVKDHEKFEQLFKLYFGKYFDLYSSDEFIKEGYLGNFNPKFKDFLLDYISVAKDKYCINLSKGDFIMKATHAGGTKEEMIIPLVLLEK